MKRWMEGRKKENYEGRSERVKHECGERRMEGIWEGAHASPPALFPSAADTRGTQEQPRTRPSQSRPRSGFGIAASVRLLQGDGDQPRR